MIGLPTSFSSKGISSTTSSPRSDAFSPRNSQ